MNKKDLREFYIRQRELLSTQEAEVKSIQIADLFIKTDPVREIKVLHVFLPIKNKKEINTWHIIEEIWSSHPHIKMLAPSTNFADLTMQNYELRPDTKLVENKLGIPEPQGEQPSPLIPDLVLMPLLAFDTNGNRVGYGKGFYDRYLATLPRQPIKTGLSFFPPSETVSDTNIHDMPLDFCITPEKVYSWK